MLTRKRITLLNGEADLAPVIDLARLQKEQQARDILQQAQQQAEQLLADAEQEAESIRLHAQQSAEQDFWQQANTLLSDWQQQQQRIETDVLAVMDEVLSQALGQLLSDIPEPARLNALLRQLLREKTQADQGSLYCHPSQQSSVAEWLQRHSHLDWQLQPDESMQPESLKLVTSQGELYLDWQQAVSQLLPE
ncbi:type III secretion system stator protein SctL, partial [Erwinia psidii]